MLIFCVSGLGRGGAELFLGRLASAIRECRSEEILVIGLKKYDSSSAVDYLKAERLNFVNGISLKTLFKIFRFVDRCKRENSVATVSIHGWMYHGGLLALVLRILLGRIHRVSKFGLFVRQTLPEITTQKILTRWVIRFCALMSRRFDFVCYNSRQSIFDHEAIGFRPKACYYIPNFFNYSSPPADQRLRIMRSPPITWQIGWIGRDHPMKNLIGCSRFFESICANSTSTFKLYLAGIEMEQAEKYFAYRWLESGAVVPLGDVKNIPDFLETIDVVISTSIYGEGCPNSLGEAIMAGCFVLGPDMGDIPNMLMSESFVYPPGDINALRRLFLNIIRGPQMFEQSRFKTRAHFVSHYSRSTILRQFNEIL